MLRYYLYNLILHLATPIAILYLLCVPRHRALLRRFWPDVPESDSAPVWIHACSVGEAHVARGIINALHARCPDMPVLLTLSTLSGLSLARSKIKNAYVTLAPFEIVWSVRGFLRRARPRILVLIETEVWPGLVRETHRRGINVAVVNARISNAKYAVYQRYGGLLPPVFPLLGFVGVQNVTYASRFELLGAPARRITVTGDVKCDAVVAQVDDATLDILRQECGFSCEDQILIFGCTRPGEENLAARCWAQLKNRFPQLRLIVAPRHLNRLEEAMAPFADEPIARRSEGLKEKQHSAARVFFLDVFGELSLFYALATTAVVGGSFYSGVEGHNPLEPAALGVPTIFGPHMGCFPDAVAMLRAANGAIQVATEEELLPVLRQLLDDPSMRNRLGAQGRRAVAQNRGAAERNVEQLIYIMAGRDNLIKR